MLVKFGVPKNQKVYWYGYHVKYLRHILKHGVVSTFGVEPLSGVDFLEWRFGVTLADSDLLLMNKVSGKKSLEIFLLANLGE